MNTRREKIAPKEYALVAAAEAAERVALLPPPASVESLIAEVLAHCSKASNSALPLADFINCVKIDSLKAPVAEAGTRQLCPLTSLLGVRRAGGTIDGASVENLNISARLKVSPTEAANQYFRELTFLRALAQLG